MVNVTLYLLDSILFIKDAITTKDIHMTTIQLLPCTPGDFVGGILKRVSSNSQKSQIISFLS